MDKPTIPALVSGDGARAAFSSLAGAAATITGKEWRLAVLADALGIGACALLAGALAQNLAGRDPREAAVLAGALFAAEAGARIYAAGLGGNSQQPPGSRVFLLGLPGALLALFALAAASAWVALLPVAALTAVVALRGRSRAAAAECDAEIALRRERCEDWAAECQDNRALARSASMLTCLARRMMELVADARCAERAAPAPAFDLARSLAARTGLAAIAAAAMSFATGHHAPATLLAFLLVLRLGDWISVAPALLARAPRDADLSPDEAPLAPSLSASPVLRVKGRLASGEALDFVAPPGAIVVLSSFDGSRTSAVLRALSGAEPFASGGAWLDGAPIGLLKAHAPRAIALVRWRSGLFAGTILENLTLFGMGASVERALSACDLLRLRVEIDRLPNGLRTRIGEHPNLPTSLERRLLIARAIALQPAVLLLDEPQASLDAEGEADLTNALRALRGRCTIILATSRPSLASLADTCIALDEALDQAEPRLVGGLRS